MNKLTLNKLIATLFTNSICFTILVPIPVIVSAVGKVSSTILSMSVMNIEIPNATVKSNWIQDNEY